MFASFRPYAPTLLLALLIAYFSVSALTGERGLLGDRKRSTALSQRMGELARLRAQGAELEARARLLTDDDLSADLLDERARSVLGFADPREYVIRVHRSNPA